MNMVQKALKSGDTWKIRLRSSVVKFGFNLNLSQSMLEFLCAVADDVRWDRSLCHGLHCPENWLVTSASLIKRGLVEHKPPLKLKKQLDDEKYKDWGSMKSMHELTDAGKHVVELIKMAGVFEQASASIAKKLGNK